MQPVYAHRHAEGGNSTDPRTARVVALIETWRFVDRVRRLVGVEPATHSDLATQFYGVLSLRPAKVVTNDTDGGHKKSIALVRQQDLSDRYQSGADSQLAAGNAR